MFFISSMFVLTLEEKDGRFIMRVFIVLAILLLCCQIVSKGLPLICSQSSLVTIVTNFPPKQTLIVTCRHIKEIVFQLLSENISTQRMLIFWFEILFNGFSSYFAEFRWTTFVLYKSRLYSEGRDSGLRPAAWFTVIGNSLVWASFPSFGFVDGII